MNSSNIRNFSIIAHIDHGKSTLADRILEITGSVEKRKMKEQLLDSMELERERGITIKMQPVRMKFKDHVLNLIDTPGHIDFNYEVSRALKAVEGAVLLVDATQGVQAQTITNVEMAKCLGLVIIPVLNKIDLPTARIDEVKKEVMEFLECGEEEVLQVSGKTGAGVEELLSEIVKRVPPPKEEISSGARAIVFDFEYSLHQGMIVYVRVTDGEIKKGDQLKLYQAGEIFSVGEIGFFSPEKKPADSLSAGEIGYIVTAIKKASIGTVGDTVVSVKEPLSPLGGYMQPKPVVWASIYPESQEDLAEFRRSLERLKLSDSSLSFEEEQSGSMGRGFRCGFLGMLHLEIVIERLKREFNLNLVVAMPTITYKVLLMDDKEVEIYSPNLFPEENLIKKVFEGLTQYSYEHIFIDNDSKDKTVSILKKIAQEDKRVKIIVNSRNFGWIRSPYHAILQAKGDAVTNIASDLQDPPEMIADFLKKWEEGYKIVVGVKKESKESFLMFGIRNLFYDIIEKLSEIKQIKNFFGFGLYDKKIVDVLRTIKDPYPYFRGLICEIGFEVAKIEYAQPKREKGRAKNNFYNLYDVAMLGITSYSKVPLRLATMLGFFVSTMSIFVAFGYLIYKLIFWNNFDVGIAPLVIGLFFFSSVQLFFIGIIGEYIGSIHTQVLKRPLVIEEERINF